MATFIAIIVFLLSLYLFFITSNKIKNIKENILIEDAKKELESVIAEFNGAAARNIEMLETKIAELQELIRKANDKTMRLDERIERANRPIVVERVIERKPKPLPEKKPSRTRQNGTTFRRGSPPASRRPG